MHETDTIFKAGVAALAGMIKRKELSPVEVVDVFLQRIWQHNDKINAFCTVAAEEAGKRAKEIEKAVMLDEDLPLGGIPIAIKDLTPTKGIRTSFGSKIFAENVPSYDATFVTRVKQAGAIVIGKTNTPEFGYTGTTDNLILGKPVILGILAGPPAVQVVVRQRRWRHG